VVADKSAHAHSRRGARGIGQGVGLMTVEAEPEEAGAGIPANIPFRVLGPIAGDGRRFRVDDPGNQNMLFPGAKVLFERKVGGAVHPMLRFS